MWRSAGDAQPACLRHWMADSAACACAAAALLKAREAELPGTVVLLFQPAEEGGAGGKRFVEEGALEGVLGIHGIHVWPGIPAGIITSRVTAATPSPDTLLLQLKGAAEIFAAKKLGEFSWEGRTEGHMPPWTVHGAALLS